MLARDVRVRCATGHLQAPHTNSLPDSTTNMSPCVSLHTLCRAQAKKAAEAAAKPVSKKAALLDDSTEETDPTLYFENRVKVINAKKAKGLNPYPHKFNVTMALPDYVAKYKDLEAGSRLDDVVVAVAGTCRVWVWVCVGVGVGGWVGACGWLGPGGTREAAGTSSGSSDCQQRQPPATACSWSHVAAAGPAGEPVKRPTPPQCHHCQRQQQRQQQQLDHKELGQPHPASSQLCAGGSLFIGEVAAPRSHPPHSCTTLLCAACLCIFCWPNALLLPQGV